MQKFRTLKGMKKDVNSMTVQGLLKMFQKFGKTGSFDVQSGRGKKGIDSGVNEEEAKTVLEELNCGVKPFCARGIVSTVHKIFRNILHCYPYKISHVQELFPSDLPAREIFTLEFLVRMEMDVENFVDRRSLFSI